MNYDAIKKAAEGYRADMAKFLRDMIAIPSESCEEEGVVKRIAAEMEKLGYDKVEFDKLGNVIGWMGTGDKIIGNNTGNLLFANSITRLVATADSRPNSREQAYILK